MDALNLLRGETGLADGLMTQVLAGVTDEQAVWQPAGGTTNPIASIAVHAYFTQDRIVARLAGREMIAESGGWAQRLGINPSAIWTPLADPSMEIVRGYAAAVQEATRAFLDSFDPVRFDEDMELPFGRRTVADALGLALVVHKSAHLGEIAALIGAQGGKGLPI